MEIKYTKKTCITGRLLKEYMLESLEDKKILLNLGNSHLNIGKYIIEGYNILNSLESIRNSANKRRMFRLFKENNIRCLKYVPIEDLNTSKYFLERLTSQFFIRNGYATIKEDKSIEYRIIVFRNRILKTYIKIPQTNEFILKKQNCVFKRMRMPFDYNIQENIINSVKCLGLDLAGVDMLINKKGEDKIIEVNSGPGMGIPTIKMLYRQIERYINNELYI